MSETKFCCDAFASQAKTHKAFLGGGFAYSPDHQPTGQIEPDSDGSWNVNGCCGGGCYVLTGLRYCPWCGERIADQKDRGVSE